ncbi:MAG TPA: hypothetical protein VGN72_21265 [Tepidisphaeraceae bacterium]|jgi:hypothetical protein|nr:hypothetical protein [Tepidisphaeraceae bacterium]
MGVFDSVIEWQKKSADKEAFFSGVNRERHTVKQTRRKFFYEAGKVAAESNERVDNFMFEEARMKWEERQMERAEAGQEDDSEDEAEDAEAVDDQADEDSAEEDAAEHDDADADDADDDESEYDEADEDEADHRC